IALVQDEPATALLLRRANDFAVYRAPVRLSERMPAGQRGALEYDVRDKVLRRDQQRGGRDENDGARGECSSGSLHCDSSQKRNSSLMVTWRGSNVVSAIVPKVSLEPIPTLRPLAGLSTRLVFPRLPLYAPLY